MSAKSGHTSLTRIEPFFTPTFTGKERDEETGYGYFGARYMDHELMTMWLSVDPMADKYPSISRNTGGSHIRNGTIKTERKLRGLSDNHGFKTFYNGTGKVKKK